MRVLLCLAVAVVLAGMLPAGPITVSSYSMRNGATGSYDYRDFTYVPCNSNCTVTSAPLSGGTGKLTDGISPALDWYQQGNNTSWVGWAGLLDPVVTFFFSGTESINTVTVWASNSRSGGVALPSAVVIGGNSWTVATDTGNLSPRALTFTGLNLTGNSLTVQFDQATSFSWVMIGEVSFDGAPSNVPEPTTWVLVGLALPALGALRRR